MTLLGVNETHVLAVAAGHDLAVDLLTILACAGLVAVVLSRFRLSAVPAYLIAGVLIGPSAMGLIEAERVVEIFRVAIVLLAFVLGLHMDLGAVRPGTAAQIAAGAVSTLIGAALLAVAARLLGLAWPAAAAAGAAFSLSSPALALRALQSRRELQRVHGRLVFDVLLAQAVVLIAFTGWFAAPPGGAADVFGGGAVRFGAMVILLAAARFVLPSLVRLATRGAGGEVAFVVAAAVALAAVGAASALGFPIAAGAFVAGIALAPTPFRYQVAGQMTPVRDLFAAVFFTTVGLGIDLPALAAVWWAPFAAAALVLLIKGVVIAACAWAGGAPAPAAARAGIVLGHAGELSLLVLVAAAAQRGDLFDARSLAALAGGAALSLAVAPSLVQFAPHLTHRLRNVPPAPWARRHARPAEPAPAPETPPGEGLPPAPARRPVIVVGYGPVGRAVAEQVEQGRAPVTIVELNPQTVRRQLELGRSIVFGDAREQEVLETAGIEHAGAVVLTIPDEQATLAAIRLVRSLRPDIFISARTDVLSQAMLAREAGADHVTVEEMATADLMARQVIEQLDQRRPAPEEPQPA